MKSKSVLIVGCGDIGARVGSLLISQGWQVAAVRRDSTKLPRAFDGYAADYAQPGSLDFVAKLQPDYVLTTFNPTERSVAGYRAGFTRAMANLLAGLGSHRPRHIIAVSSTRVFAENSGGWVDEGSPLSTEDPRAVAMVEAEQLLLASDHAASVVRFAGIYGAPGGRLLSRIARGELCSAEPPRYSNRIHRDDCAGFLLHLLHSADAGDRLEPVYIGVDDKPSLRFEVESWLADVLDVPIKPGSEVPPSQQTTGHKRCHNKALRASGYQLLYPDYRSGYSAVLS
jgi:nucleoside-diphosphate-sugar epimerase